MRKYGFEEMNVYLSLIDTDTIVSEYNAIEGGKYPIFSTCNIDVRLAGKTPTEICKMSSGGYFSLGEKYYTIDEGNMVSVPTSLVRYFIERHLTFNELFKLCQNLGIERDLK